MVTKKQRERALARQKWERQEAKRAERRRKVKRRSIVGGAVVLVLAVAVGTTGIWWAVRDDPTANPTPTPSATVPTPSSAPQAPQGPWDLPLLKGQLPSPTPGSSE